LICRRADSSGSTIDDDSFKGTSATFKSYSSNLPFPIPDSLPMIFPSDATFITGLATESSMSLKLKTLKNSVHRYISTEDRESVGNDLSKIADEYREGWSSGSDEDYD